MSLRFTQDELWKRFGTLPSSRISSRMSSLTGKSYHDIIHTNLIRITPTEHIRSVIPAITR
jgi:hypothetical protein